MSGPVESRKTRMFLERPSPKFYARSCSLQFIPPHLHMPQPTLPVECLQLILDLLADDLSTLAALLCVNKFIC